MSGTYYKAGSWNVICQMCGKEYKADEIKKRWDGLLVCTNDYETRHPADLLRIREEKVGVPFVSPEPEDRFIMGPHLCTGKGSTSIPGDAIPGCAVPHFITPLF